MWDIRFNCEDYVYGTEANDFLKENVQHLPKGKILSLAEGEGRNAVFLAKLGYQVTAVDSSIVGINKAKQLAQLNKVNIEFIHSDLADFKLGEACWDGIISIFCPMSPDFREALHQKVNRGLKKGGVYLVEAYRPEQVHRDTGGGDDATLMQTKETLTQELEGLSFQFLNELEREVIEGKFHTGTGSVVQAIAKKE